ncbi:MULTISPECIES: PTS sugar transporter subunit IIA [Paenarthrobacter]|jgi:PTS system ascorbate-specific IIA component|uniref:PTS sugar transporter subunit IIA n=1 Tax=Paenarthrobacter TaxID=1742992 RepID=UPI00074D3363|nr:MULTISPECIES: PTS sugar transporter subunit IIA [Paenarthrobacter]AMB40381.1 PTS ascorbate transporter subunit IIA [Arthrobacter sp. ATCC 21022]BCW84159.1 PTS ascorbate transporter subunit IIA [Arthrobacter sp. NicSoilE8]KUR63582.1 PTS ascorbate transporter subunit IIA [Arthrobacter sp. ATCC 21022]MCW3765290.1 PTS sugar transporter subunit IIA [Paenarthrobacter sp. PAE-2]RWW91542.1 PTS sugar transporter subunit IIA [Paenarthrobacter ureafaciens]
MSLSLAESLCSISTNAPARDWRAAIRLAGDGLVNGGAATAEYTEQMITAVEEHGPYIVIAPGIALAHARPSDAVLHGGMSWVSLESPVEFGNPRNDPVTLVIGLAALDHTAHIEALKAMAGVLGNDAIRARLSEAQTPEDVRAILSQATA